MDQRERIAHIELLLQGHAEFSRRLHDHRNALLGHQRSRERDHALLHCVKDIRRADKLQRRLERALRNEAKQHGRNGAVSRAAVSAAQK